MPASEISIDAAVATLEVVERILDNSASKPEQRLSSPANPKQPNFFDLALLCSIGSLALAIVAILLIPRIARATLTKALREAGLI
jgi:hypothetical protein